MEENGSQNCKRSQSNRFETKRKQTNIMSTSVSKSSAGSERFKADKRQFAGLMFALAICVTFQPLAGIVSAIGPDGTTASSGLPLAGLISGLILVVTGSLGTYAGYLTLVHDYGNKILTGVLLVLIQFTWLPFLTDLTSVGRITASGEGFIPPEYTPTQSDVKFVGSMGMIGILTYASAFVGSFAFMAFALFAYQVGKPTDRNGTYYQGRFTFYTLLVTLAGLSQLLLGSFVLSRFGSGPLSPPIGVAMYIVHFPGLNIAVGLVQFLTGVFGLARRYGYLNNGKDDNRYQKCIATVWMLQLSVQILTQVGYAPGGMLAPAAPTIACLSLGMNVIAAFLDWKMRTVPAILPSDYYGTYGDLVEVAEKSSVYEDSTSFHGELAKEMTKEAMSSEDSNTEEENDIEIASIASSEYNA